MNLEAHESAVASLDGELTRLQRFRNWLPRLQYTQDRTFTTIFFVYFFLPLLFTPYLVTEVFEAPKLALFILGFAVTLLLGAYTKRFQVRISKPLLVCLGGFAFWIILSTITSLDPIQSSVGLVGRHSNSAIFLLLWTGWLIFLLGTLTENRWWYLAKTIYIGGFISAGYSILQTQGIGYYAGLENVTRVIVPGLLGNPNFNGMYLVVVLPLGILWFSVTRKFHTKILLLVSGAIVVWALVLSASRGAILGLLVALLSQFIVNLSGAKKISYAVTTAVTILLVVILAWLYFPILRPGDVNQSVNFQEANQQYRLVAWDLATETIKSRPWFGTGIANFHLDFKARGWSVFSVGERFDDPHNLILLLATDGGLPLLGFFLGILGIAGRGLFGLGKSRDVSVATSAGALTGLLVAMMFGPVVIACWLLLAFLIVSLMYKNLPVTVWKLSRIWQITLSLIGILLVLSTICWFAGQIFAYQSDVALKFMKVERSYQLSKIGYTLNFTSGLALRDLILTRIQLGYDPVETDKLIKQALHRHRNDSTFLMDSAPLYYFLWQQTQDSKYLDEMSLAIEHAIAKEPRFSRLYSQAAYLEFKSGDTNKALQYQRLSLTYNSEQTYGWVLLSKLYYDLNMRDQAIASLEKAFLNSNETLVLKKMLTDFKKTDNIQSVPFAVTFPEPQK